MHIAIVGAGIAGLSSYLFLVKHILNDDSSNHSINIYESHDIFGTGNSSRGSNGESIFMPKAVGAAIGIGKNGLSVLHRIDNHGELLRNIRAKGHTISRWKMGSARGWTIADAAVTSSQKTNPVDENSIPDMVMIARYNVWAALRDEVFKQNSEAVIVKKLTKLESLSNGRVELNFEDESTDVADLVIGADGLRSFVRRTMFNDANDIEPQTLSDWIFRRAPKKKDYITPHFEGLVGLGGLVPSEVLDESGFEKGSMAVTFGANGFFGHGYLGQRPNLHDQGDNLGNPGGVAAWWSTFSCSDANMFRTKEAKRNLDSSDEFKADFDKQAALSSLLTRHQSWNNPTIKLILQYVAENRALEHTYPTYTTPELPTWQTNGNMVLVGDAAHALQPSSGQGASQALEDAESLALFLKHYLQSAKTVRFANPEVEASGQRRAIASALTDFVLFRKPRVAQIYKQSRQMSNMKADMNVLQEFVMYFFIWLMSKLQVMQKYNEALLEYNLPAEVAIAIYEGSNLCTVRDVPSDELDKTSANRNT